MFTTAGDRSGRKRPPRAISAGGTAATGAGTTNTHVKWTDGPNGKLGDSIASETGAFLTVNGTIVPNASDSRDVGRTDLRYDKMHMRQITGGNSDLTVAIDNGAGTLKDILNFATGGAVQFIAANFTGIDFSSKPLTSAGSVGISQGTITSNLQAISSTATWNSGGITFTHLKFNITDTASATASLLLDMQIGSASKFTVRKDGLITNGVATTTSFGSI